AIDVPVAAVAGACVVERALAVLACSGQVGQFGAVDHHQFHRLEGTRLQAVDIGQVLDVDAGFAREWTHRPMLALRNETAAARNRTAPADDAVPACRY